MQKKSLIFFSFFFLAYTLTAQDIDYAKNIIKTLSSEEFTGRGYVEEGERMAADYISSEFEKLGLKPLKRQYYQYFNVSVNTFPDAMFLKIGDEVLEAGKDFIIDPVSASLEGTFKTFTISKQELLDDQKVREMVRESVGAFLLIDERGYKSEDKEAADQINKLIGYLKYSPEMQTAGTIIITEEKLTWGMSSLQLSRPIFIVNKGADNLTAEEVEVIVDAELIKKYKTQNVIGYIKGQVQADSYLVMTAHYDHLGRMGSDVYIPGANDNASGVAMLLNLAKHFSEHPPDFSMVFMALGAEELGILGAKHYTENPVFNLGSIKFLVNFDLAGTGDEGIKVVNGSVHKKEFSRLKSLNEEKNYLPAVKSRGAACNSDHCMFHEKEVPCFYIYTLGGIQAYHDIYDRYETLPLTEFEDYVSLMVEFFAGF